MAQVDEERLALALSAARLGTWTWDIAAGTTIWDVRLEELHGLAPGGFGGTFEDWLASLHPGDRAECLARVERALADPGPYSLLHRTIWPDGSLHWVECRGKVLTDGAGVPTGTIGVAFDVTEREERQAALVRQRAEDHRIVQTVQRALLPIHLPRVDGVDTAARYESAAGAAEIGGDWYAIVPLPDGRLGVAIGDVAGHGLPAIAEMAHARFTLRSLAYTEQDPSRVLQKLSEITGVFAPETMITALYGVVDPTAGSWDYAVAGHCPPVVRSADGVVAVEQCAPDPPLGLGVEYRVHHTTIAPGSTIVLYTDGLLERRGESFDVGLDRLAASLTAAPDEPDALCAFLMGELLSTGLNDDDAAVVAFRLS